MRSWLVWLITNNEMKPCTLLAVYYRKCKTAAWIFCFANCCNLYTCLIFCYTCHICSLHRNSKMEVSFFGLLIYTRFCHHHSYFAVPDQVNSICFTNFCVEDNRLESTRIFQLWQVSTSREYSQTRRSSLNLWHTSDLPLSWSSRVFLTPFLIPHSRLARSLRQAYLQTKSVQPWRRSAWNGRCKGLQLTGRWSVEGPWILQNLLSSWGQWRSARSLSTSSAASVASSCSDCPAPRSEWRSGPMLYY